MTTQSPARPLLAALRAFVVLTLLCSSALAQPRQSAIFLQELAEQPDVPDGAAVIYATTDTLHTLSGWMVTGPTATAYIVLPDQVADPASTSAATTLWSNSQVLRTDRSILTPQTVRAGNVWPDNVSSKLGVEGGRWDQAWINNALVTRLLASYGSAESPSIAFEYAGTVGFYHDSGTIAATADLYVDGDLTADGTIHGSKFLLDDPVDEVELRNATGAFGYGALEAWVYGDRAAAFGREEAAIYSPLDVYGAITGTSTISGTIIDSTNLELTGTRLRHKTTAHALNLADVLEASIEFAGDPVIIFQAEQVNITTDTLFSNGVRFTDNVLPTSPAVSVDLGGSGVGERFNAGYFDDLNVEGDLTVSGTILGGGPSANYVDVYDGSGNLSMGWDGTPILVISDSTVEIEAADLYVEGRVRGTSLRPVHVNLTFTDIGAVAQSDHYLDYHGVETGADYGWIAPSSGSIIGWSVRGELTWSSGGGGSTGTWKIRKNASDLAQTFAGGIGTGPLTVFNQYETLTVTPGTYTFAKGDIITVWFDHLSASAQWDTVLHEVYVALN